MKTIGATELRYDLFGTLKRLAYGRDPILIERRGRPIAALVTPDFVASASTARARSSVRAISRPTIDPRALADFCERRRIKKLYLFGSVLTGRFDADSDVDAMFEPEGSMPGYFEQMEMTDELTAMFGRPVDLVSKSAVEASSNAIRRQSILDGARVVYAK